MTQGSPLVRVCRFGLVGSGRADLTNPGAAPENGGAARRTTLPDDTRRAHHAKTGLPLWNGDSLVGELLANAAILLAPRLMMNNDILAKLIVTAVMLISMIVWLDFERHAGCANNCPADISAERR